MNSLEDSTRSITQALATLDDPAGEGDFTCRATLPADTLALSIDGFGDLRLPVPVTRAKALARIATPAPFGLGRATVVDPNVRHVGEIKASKVRFDRRAWSRELKPVLETMRVELGLPDGRLTAKLDKLLVYGAGQFFKPHKDTERSDDMVGTLVVVLPSKHKGGALAISHQGRTRRFIVRSPANPVLRLFAFYATCEHEVRPVTEGHRVVLSFELRFKRAANTQRLQIDSSLKQALDSWFDPTREPARSYGPATEKLVYLLDHEYSQRSLAWNRLKGMDHRRAEALQVAGESLGLQAHLALITVSETWSASIDEPRYYRSRRARPDWYDESDDDEDSDETSPSDLVATTSYELEELIERGASLAHWRNSTDQAVQIPLLQAYDEELCWLTELEHSDPVLEEYEGFMGNYGNTLEREYQRAAVVLWPTRDRYRILAKAGGEEGGAMALQELELDAAELDATSLDAAVRSLLDVWPGRQRSQDSKLLGIALSVSSHLSKTDTVIELLCSFSLAALKPARFKALLILGQRFGAGFCQLMFAHWTGAIPIGNAQEVCRMTERKPRYGRAFDREVDRHRLHWLPHFANFCRRVTTLKDDAWQGQPKTLFDTLHTLAVERHAKNHAQMSRRALRENLDRECTELVSLLKAAKEIDDGAINRVIDVLFDSVEHYASEVPIAVLEHLEREPLSTKSRKKVEALRSHTRSIIQARAERAKRSENDWTIDVVPNCECVPCQSLACFLESQERAIDLPLAKERRRHLHGRIEYLEIPVSHSTRRQGRPFVLELRKLKSLFRDSAREHARELALSKLPVLMSG